MKQMSEDLAVKVERLTNFERTYCEFRSKGQNQTQAAKSAGSTANYESGSLARVGYNTEQKEGVKEYIVWLTGKRAEAALVDDTEIIEKIRRVYDEAIALGKLSDANKAMEMLAQITGLLGKGGTRDGTASGKQSKDSTSPKNDTTAFKEDKEGMDIEERQRKLKQLLNDS